MSGARLPLLSFSAAQVAGEAMYDRWRSQADEPPPFEKSDAAWADLARASYEAVRQHLAPNPEEK